MMKWKFDMTEEEEEALMREIRELDECYLAAQTQAAIDRIEDRFMQEELEAEADLYRYWQP